MRHSDSFALSHRWRFSVFHPKNDTVKPDISESLAIVGMACRLPGAVASLDDFWSLSCL